MRKSFKLPIHILLTTEHAGLTHLKEELMPSLKLKFHLAPSLNLRLLLLSNQFLYRLRQTKESLEATNQAF